MKRILILLASLLVVGNVYALPQCPPPDPKKVYQIARGLSLQEDWHNCIGSWKYFEFSFSGEYRDGDKYGYGILKNNENGEIHVGMWRGSGLPYEGIEIQRSGKVTATFSGAKRCEGCKPTARQMEIVQEIDPSLIPKPDDSWK